MSTAAAGATDFFSKLRTCPECDEYFRMRSGTALAAVKAALLRSSVRSRAGRTSYLVDPTEAARLWGPR